MAFNSLDIFDLLLSPFYILIIYIIALNYRNLNYIKRGKQHYKFFISALFCKIAGGIALCLIYTYYYVEGGDVTNYYLTTCTYSNVLLSGNFSLFYDLLSKSTNASAVAQVNAVTNYGYVYFSASDSYAYVTVLLTLPFCLIACKSFIATTVLLASASFIGLWKLFEVFVANFPAIYKGFAIAIFFVPSVFFWGSGILKDTYALSGVGFFTYAIYKFVILRERKTKYLLMLVFSFFMIILIKPYIFFALLPGAIIWNYFYKIQKIKNPIIRSLSLPIIFGLIGAFVFLGLTFFSQYLGEYRLDNVLNKAVKTQQDLIRSQYGSNSFNIGEFDASLAGIASKIPAAINMALFRPYIWDARNPVMLISGLENLFMLGFSLYIVFKVKITVLLRSLFAHPLLIFSFLFALFFAFSVGLTTANYGALVRLKIPCIPFYLCSLFILYQLNKESFKARK